MREAYKATKEIQLIGICVEAYITKHEKMPGKIFEAIYEDDYGSTLAGGTEKWKKIGRVVDPWGSEYRLTGNIKEFHVWSVGVNHKDESGIGDDVGFKSTTVYLPANSEIE